MRDHIDVHGASGRAYRFTRVRDDRPLSPMGGNFLYVRERGETWEILYAGEGQNLLAQSRQRWDEAARAHGASHLFMRLNISEIVRQKEHNDIVAAALPAMNPQPPEPAA